MDPYTHTYTHTHTHTCKHSIRHTHSTNKTNTIYIQKCHLFILLFTHTHTLTTGTDDMAPQERTGGQAGEDHGRRHLIHVHFLLRLPVRHTHTQEVCKDLS